MLELINFTDLTDEQILMILRWRNDERVAKYMKNKSVSEQEHRKFIANLKNDETKRYFLEKNLENKMKGYRQKLTSSIVAKDYDRFIEIMLQLSSYTETAFPFLHELIKDFEGNKNLAYEFINNLNNFQDRN